MPPPALRVCVPLEEDVPQRTWSLSDTGTFSTGDFSFKMSKLGHGNVSIHEVLGRGAGGTVRRAVHQTTEVAMACKIIDVHDETARSLVNELRSIDACSHANLVQFFGAYFLDHSIYLLCELMAGGCCQQFLRRSGGSLAEEVVASIACDVIDALAYLQVERHMVHRDVKPGNILFSADGTCKLGDYGILKVSLSQGKLRESHCRLSLLALAPRPLPLSLFEFETLLVCPELTRRPTTIPRAP